MNEKDKIEILKKRIDDAEMLLKQIRLIAGVGDTTDNKVLIRNIDDYFSG